MTQTAYPEYEAGTIIGGPRKDGKCKGYSDSLPPLLWDELLTLLAKHKVQSMEILFLGKVGSEGKCGAVGWAVTDRRAVQREATERWDPSQGPISEITKNGNMTNVMVADLLGLNVVPEHVVGVVVRKLS